MIIMAWNCRGCGSPRTVQILRRWCFQHKPDILFLSETMSKGKNMEELKFKFGFTGAIGVDSVGNSGGLCLFWKDNIDFKLESYSRNHIIGQIQNINMISWTFCGFYGHPKFSEKHLSWNLLRTLFLHRPEPVVVGGDFNEILHQEEKMGGTQGNSRQIKEFRGTISDCHLMDFGCIDENFTWERGQTPTTRIRERLDRFLGSQSWYNLFPKVEIQTLPRIASDHAPIILNSNGFLVSKYKGSLPFRMEPNWIQNKHSSEVFQKLWTQSSEISFLQKLANSVHGLSSWGKAQNSNFSSRIKELESKISHKQNQSDSNWN